MTGVEEPRACPECEQNKCRNCNGDAWDNEADDYAPCPCAARGHKAVEQRHAGGGAWRGLEDTPTGGLL